MANKDTPTFNLKAVVRETGLKPDTLRAWERRYGVPEPDRSGGGHRLYSQQDINTIKWLLARQAEGMSISRAVGLWRSLLDEGRDPFQVSPLAPAGEPPSLVNIRPGDTVIELRHAWINACLAFDERRAETVLNQAFSYYSPEVVCFELLQKALSEIGNGWYAGDVSVQQEHFASALAVRRLDALLAATPAPTRAGRLIIGCPPGESHTFSPLLVTYLLRRRGWDVVYLGANVPTYRLQATIESTRPALVVFSAQTLDTAATLLDVAHYLREINVALAFGGYIFNTVPELAQRIPGHFLGRELDKTPYAIEQLALNAPPVPAHEPVSADYQDAWATFRERSALIDVTIWQMYDNDNVNGRRQDAGRYLTSNILSALRLGDLNYIGSNLAWIQGMMINHNLSPRLLCDFLREYRRAAEVHLDGAAKRLVLEWMAHAIEACEEAADNPDQPWAYAA